MRPIFLSKTCNNVLLNDTASNKLTGLYTVYPKELIDPGCQGSLINQDGVLHTSNANTTSGRTHVTVKSSTDQGASWSQGSLVWEGPSGYSQLVSVGDPKIVGILLEAGRKSTYETISFAVVAL